MGTGVGTGVGENVGTGVAGTIGAGVSVVVNDEEGDGLSMLVGGDKSTTGAMVTGVSVGGGDATGTWIAVKAIPRLAVHPGVVSFGSSQTQRGVGE